MNILNWKYNFWKLRIFVLHSILREGILLHVLPFFANLRVRFLLKHFELEIQFLKIKNLHFTPLCKKECCFMIFANLRMSFLLEHFELEMQFLEIENLE